MLDFVKDAFRNAIAVILWINLILFTIVGGIAGYLVSEANGGGGGVYVILGIIIGLICGLLTDIVGGGYIATILNMDENLEIIAVNILKTGSSLPTKKCPRCNKDVAVDYTGCPHCGNSFVESNTSILQGSSTTTENTKKCKHCSIRVSADKTVCPKCGGTDFIYS